MTETNEKEAREEPLERLARCLYNEMEFLDPSVDEVDWAALTERERDFYRLSVKGLFRYRENIVEVLNGELLAHHDMVGGGTEESEQPDVGK